MLLQFHEIFRLTDTGLEKKVRHKTVCPLEDISLRVSFYSSSHFSKQIRAREFAWPLKRHRVLYWLNEKLYILYMIILYMIKNLLQSHLRLNPDQTSNCKFSMASFSSVSSTSIFSLLSSMFSLLARILS